MSLESAAPGAAPPAEGSGSLTIVGIGPGNHAHMTDAAREAIAAAQVVVGYGTYIRLVKELIAGKEVIRTGMTEEIGRASMAVARARAGERVALISSGDAGVYGMAGLVFQVLREQGWTRNRAPQVRLVPGMTALNSCASLLGAPLGHDFCAISLSDLLTPWPSIVRKLEAAASADFVVGLYNPASGRRTRQIVEAQAILRRHRDGATPVGIVKSAYRAQQQVVLTDLDTFLEYEIGMNTTVIVGSSNTIAFEGYMITPRGYSNKYTWAGETLPGQRPGYSLALDPPATVGESG